MMVEKTELKSEANALAAMVALEAAAVAAKDTAVAAAAECASAALFGIPATAAEVPQSALPGP